MAAVDGGCLFFSARTDLDFRRTPRILAGGSRGQRRSSMPSCPRDGFAATLHRTPSPFLERVATDLSINDLDIDYGSTTTCDGRTFDGVDDHRPGESTHRLKTTCSRVSRFQGELVLTLDGERKELNVLRWFNSCGMI